MKDLIISYNDKVGFYCEDVQYPLLYIVLDVLVQKYDLIPVKEEDRFSEICMYFCLRDLNKDKYNIELREEDGSNWVFG